MRDRDARQGPYARANHDIRHPHEDLLAIDRRLPWNDLNALVRRDPTGRGVASYVERGAPLCEHDLQNAACDLAERATSVAIVTGFCIVGALAGSAQSPQIQAPAAETDGPPGALLLARSLAALGVEVSLVSDAYGRPLLEAGCDHWGLPRGMIREFPLAPAADFDLRPFLADANGKPLSHLIAIERVGPSHTPLSLAVQSRDGAAPIADFERAVPPDERDVCHNMRGAAIDAYTAPIHRLFDQIAERALPITTIGVGDGGNEIGMGSIPWETLCQSIAVGPAARVACRIATTHSILAGVSDWGAQALALSLPVLCGHAASAPVCTAVELGELIEMLVAKAGAVDGVTGRSEATVDGLPLETYLQVFSGIRDALRR
ncbi:MAG TPA: glutamate cyclase domain-containing protein [Pirellulales bacterium]